MELSLFMKNILVIILALILGFTGSSSDSPLLATMEISDIPLTCYITANTKAQDLCTKSSQIVSLNNIEIIATTSIISAEAKSPSLKPTKAKKSIVQKRIHQRILLRYRRIPDYEADLIAQTIDFYSDKYELDPYLVAALIERESAYNARAVSKHGAKGLGQIMSFNLKSLGITDPYNIEQSVQGTVRYLANLRRRWLGSANEKLLTLSSYLEGPNAIIRRNNQPTARSIKYSNEILRVANIISDY